jgi:hypothetical protein
LLRRVFVTRQHCEGSKHDRNAHLACGGWLCEHTFGFRTHRVAFIFVSISICIRATPTAERSARDVRSRWPMPRTRPHRPASSEDRRADCRGAVDTPPAAAAPHSVSTHTLRAGISYKAARRTSSAAHSGEWIVAVPGTACGYRQYSTTVDNSSSAGTRVQTGAEDVSARTYDSDARQRAQDRTS